MGVHRLHEVAGYGQLRQKNNNINIVFGPCSRISRQQYHATLAVWYYLPGTAAHHLFTCTFDPVLCPIN